NTRSGSSACRSWSCTTRCTARTSVGGDERSKRMRKITPWLWFQGDAEQAAEFYTSTFKNSRIGSVTRAPEGGPMPAGTVMTAEFEIDGQAFVALNGGPEHNFTEGVSFYVDCESQEEVDYLWERLTSG